MGGNLEGVGVKLGRPHPARHGKWLLLLLPIAAVFALCYRPVMRLKSEPPAGFVEARKEWDAKRQAAEGRAARAYWQLAVNIVQWKQPYGTELPAAPSAEFKLDEKDFPQGGIEGAPATRDRYWRELREVWPLPQSWERTYVWNPAWLTEFLTSSMAGIWSFVDGLLQRFAK
jgi:hypothetical protein